MFRVAESLMNRDLHFLFRLILRKCATAIVGAGFPRPRFTFCTFFLHEPWLFTELLGNESEIEDVGCAVTVDITSSGAEVLGDEDKVEDIDSSVPI